MLVNKLFYIEFITELERSINGILKLSAVHNIKKPWQAFCPSWLKSKARVRILNHAICKLCGQN